MRLYLNLDRNGSASPLSAQNSLSRYGSNFRSLSNPDRTNSASSEAVRVSLSSRSRELSRSEESSAAQAALGTAPKSGLRSALDTLSGITSQIAQYRKQIDQQTEGDPKRAALETEISNLNGEYQRVVESSEFKRLLEVGQSVQSSLAAGARSSSIAAALQGSTALLGSDFLRLVQNGNLANLSVVTQGLSSIASSEITTISSSTTSLEALSQSITKTVKALDGSKFEAVQASAPELVVVSPSAAVPPIQQTIYSGDQDFALALRGYKPTDLIRAAAAGLDIKAAGELVLIPNPDKSEDETILEDQVSMTPFFRQF